MYWFTGDRCTITGGTTVGSPDFPVFLVSAATIETRLAGGVNFFGLIFITDLFSGDAEFVAVGTNTVYGAIVADIQEAIEIELGHVADYHDKLEMLNRFFMLKQEEETTDDNETN